MTSTAIPRLPKGTGRALIVPLRGAIQDGLVAGLRVLDLFQQLQPKLGGMSYRQFCRYTERLQNTLPPSDIDALRPRTAFSRPLENPPQPTPTTAAALPTSRQEPPEGPILPPPRPQPRRFVRRAGLPDDNKDYLLGPPG